MKELLHFDPITLGVLISAIIGGWYVMKNNIQWHTKWIQEHQKECDLREKTYTELFTEIKETDAKLVTIAEMQGQRLNRVENQIDHLMEKK